MGSRCIHLACMERILSFLRPCPASADVRRGGKHFQTATLSNGTMCELFLLHGGPSHCMWKTRHIVLQKTAVFICYREAPETSVRLDTATGRALLQVTALMPCLQTRFGLARQVLTAGGALWKRVAPNTQDHVLRAASARYHQYPE